MTKDEAVKKLLRLAGYQVGYTADKQKHNKYAEYFDTEYPTFYNGKKDGFDWCDIFVDWLFIQTFGKDTGRMMLYQPLKSCGAGVSWSYKYYKEAGAVVHDPEPGDQIFFADEDGLYHTGIVETVDALKVYTIEGNTGYKPLGGVNRFSYSKKNAAIYAYGRPDWSAAVEKVDTAEIDRICDKIAALTEATLRGEYGNNPERAARLGEWYTPVQFVINQYYKKE